MRAASKLNFCCDGAMISARFFSVIAILSLIAGCETLEEKRVERGDPLVEIVEEKSPDEVVQKQPEQRSGKHGEPAFALVKVFFATDRKLSNSKNASEVFSIQRNPGGLTLGTCEVSIPRDHRMGALEAPSLLKLEFHQDPAKHVMLQSVTVQPKKEFYSNVAARIKASRGKKAFVFVHGYNVRFEDAARRTAQIAYDLGFDGAPIFYSWPSLGLPTPLGYTKDGQTMEWSQKNLRNFLQEFFANSDAQDVYLIAHSMGNRALTQAITAMLTEKPYLKERLREIILTAPDIDAEVFRRDIAPAFAVWGRPVTLYASSNDLALMMSKKVNGYPRAGDSGRGLVIAPGIETIDATNTDTSFIGHSYYAERRSILADMFYVIMEGRRADDRFGLEKIKTRRGPYWIFRK